MLPLALTLALAAGMQVPAVDRQRADEMARAGRTAEAVEIYTRIVEADPADIDASIALASLLIRTGAWQRALDLLRPIEAAAGENADLYSTLARAYRRAGDTRLAFEYFRRAQALAPDDPEVAMGAEAVARVYGHWIAFDAFGQSGAADAWAAGIHGSLRLAPRFHVHAGARRQEGSGYADSLGGGGFLWTIVPSTTLSVHASAGSGNVALAESDVFAEMIHYRGAAEIGGHVRHLSFAGAAVTAASSLLAWTAGDRWRTDARYTFSHARFEQTGEASGDHSVLLRETWQRWRRVALLGVYVYGIESFEELTADRLGALGTTTLAGAARVDTPSLTRITLTWEHQWRSNDTTIDRVTLSIVQHLP